VSADNSVAILVTPKGNGKEYRVKEMSGVDNYLYDDEGQNDSPDVHIKNAREMWGNCKVFNDFDDAMNEAKSQYEKTICDFGIVEYGITQICIDREFQP